ncbi:MAG: SH3 domain-containing protein [Bacteroidia bacterium]
MLFWFILTQQILLAAEQYESGDTLYVWAQSGLNVRAAANISGKKIGKLQAGERVEVMSLTTKGYDIVAVDVHPELYEDNIYEEEGSSEPYYLRGTWVKVKGAKFEGYVIDSYLLKYVPPPPNTSIGTYFVDLRGESMKVDTTWETDCDGAGFVDCYSYEGRTKSGFTISGSYMMSATNHSITIPEMMTLEEGFVFLNYFYSLEDGLRLKKGIPMLKYMDGGEESMWFLEGETCEFWISVEEGKLQLSEGCSC